MAQESLERIEGGSDGKDRKSIFRVDVMCKLECYDEDSEDEVDIPYCQTDSFPLYCSYSVYADDRSSVMDEVRKAFSGEDDLYCVSVYSIPLNTRIESEEIPVSMVFDENGQLVAQKFKSGEIVEYFDPDEEVVRLAVVYYVSESIDDEGPRGYKLLTCEHELMLWDVSISQVSKPSFPVSDCLRKKLEELYKAKRVAVEKGELTFAELLDLL